MKMHSSITDDMIIDAVERGNTTLDNPGFCIACGEETDSCEPDMRKGKCDYCGKNEVYGAEELLMHIIC